MKAAGESILNFTDELRLDDSLKIDGAYVVNVRMSSGAGIRIYGDADNIPSAHIEIEGDVDFVSLPFSSPLIRIAYQAGLLHYRISQGRHFRPLQVVRKHSGSVLLP